MQDNRQLPYEETDLYRIRHSSAHVMADAVQRLFPGTKVAFGPATDNGFYYDYARPDGTFSDDDLRAIEEKMAEIIEADYPVSDYNIYPFHFSDGDNWSGGDTARCLDLLRSQLLPKANVLPSDYVLLTGGYTTANSTTASAPFSIW